MHTETYRPPALPTVGGCELQAAGVDWDAIRVPRRIGVRALAVLGPRSGAVIEDPCEPVFYWFVREGATTGWDVPETRLLGVRQHLVVPPQHRVEGPGPHWRIRPVDGRLITDVRALRTAIEVAAAPFRVP
ncbi:hypothetical protein [Streptomyces coffeae]|uniref:Uncharacterized protein n=1 Tax=Streptomyces coffeae TaxID=621382 RepID=A0ABS1NQ59_9ACTN|nr:hypothetical protein [Streptomyces coffeae]MBL1102089.1 hypothetical protein [Streptomyces coffeae]